MTRAREEQDREAALRARAPSPAGDRKDRHRLGLCAVLCAVVGAVVLAVHWPALRAQALCFDDGQYLTENELVQNPSFESAGRFLTEVLEPSTVRGYYQPLSMISLMLDYAAGGGPIICGLFM